MKKVLGTLGLVGALALGLAGRATAAPVATAEPVLAPYVYIGPDLVRIEPDGSSVYFCAVGAIVYAIVDLPAGKGCAYVRELSDTARNVR
jgi:hypothetical protein